MAQPIDYKYLHDKIMNEWGYEISYKIGDIVHTCRILCKPKKDSRTGVYQTRTDSNRAIYSFYDAKDEREAGTVAQHMLEEILSDIRKLK